MDHDPHNVTGKYVLIGQTPVPEPDLLKWAEWIHTVSRDVGRTRVGPYNVSTVFLGLDHNFSHTGPPLLFETIVFDAEGKGIEQDRCSTWSEAEEMHARMVKLMQDKCAAGQP